MKINKIDKINKNNKIKIAIICLMLILITIFGLLIYNNGNSDSKTTNNIENYNGNYSKITKISEEDKQSCKNQIVEDGMININYQTNVTFNSTESINFKVTNIEQNKYPIKFELIDENGDTIYMSDEIPQGYECTEIKLEKEHKKGSFEWQIKIGYVTGGNVSSIFPINVEIN